MELTTNNKENNVSEIITIKDNENLKEIISLHSSVSSEKKKTVKKTTEKVDKNTLKQSSLDKFMLKGKRPIENDLLIDLEEDSEIKSKKTKVFKKKKKNSL